MSHATQGPPAPHTILKEGTISIKDVTDDGVSRPESRFDGESIDKGLIFTKRNNSVHGCMDREMGVEEER